MDEKRHAKRVRRRLTVRFGEHDLSRPGFTHDVSERGAFILSDTPPPAGHHVHLQIFFDRAQFLLFEAVAVREKQVPPELRQVVRGGFGVRFLGADELLRERLAAEGQLSAPNPVGARTTAPMPPNGALPAAQSPGPAAGSASTFVIRFDSPDAFRKVYRSELKHGGVFVHTEAPLAIETAARVELDLTYAGARIACDGRVIHLSDAPGSRGFGMVFTDAAAVLAALAAHVA